jgi:hypothetical protein
MIFLCNGCYQYFKKRIIQLKKKKNSGYRESQIVLTKKYENFDGGTLRCISMHPSSEEAYEFITEAIQRQDCFPIQG